MHDNSTSFSFHSLVTPFTSSKAVHWIIFICILVYGNMLFNGFVWDDVGYIIANETIREFNIMTLFGINEFNSAGYFRPIPAVYFSLLYNLFGAQPFYYHVIQLCLHIVNTILLYFFFKKFFPLVLSFFLSIIFLIHPVQVESVAYIGATQSELLFLFGISALLLSMRKNLSVANMIGISFLLLCSLLTKETGFLFLIMVLAIQVLMRNKRFGMFFPYVLGVVILYSVIRFVLVGVFFEKNVSSPIGILSLTERILHIPALFFYYLKTLFYPAVLGIDQRWIIKSFDMGQGVLPLVISLFFFIVVGYFGYVLKKKGSIFFSYFLYFALWFFCGMGMLMQVFPLDMTVADRWMYFPLVGLLGILGSGVSLLNSHRAKRFLFIVFGIVIIVLSVRTMVRNTDWVNALTLYSRDIKVDDNYDLQNYLGAEFALQGKYQEALPHLQKGVAQFPHATNLYNLGVVYENLKKYGEAEKYYTLAVNEKENYGEAVMQNAYVGLTRVLVTTKQSQKAVIYGQKAVERFSDNGSLWAYVAISKYRLGDTKGALFAAQKAHKLLHNASSQKLLSIISQNKELDVR